MSADNIIKKYIVNVLKIQRKEISLRESKIDISFKIYILPYINFKFQMKEKQ